MTSPFGPTTVRTYRSIASATSALALLFGLQASRDGHWHGFASGLSAGMALVMLGCSILFLWLAKFVSERFHQPVEYWRHLQRRRRTTIFRTVYVTAAVGTVLTGLCWLASMPFGAGLVAAPSGLLVLLAVGQLTGQITEM